MSNEERYLGVEPSPLMLNCKLAKDAKKNAEKDRTSDEKESESEING